MGLDLSKKMEDVEGRGNIKEDMQNSRFITWRKLTFSILSIFILLLIFLFMYSLTSKKDPFADLDGIIYLTLAPKNGYAVDLYTLNVKTLQMNRIFNDDNKFVRFTNTFSPQGNKMAFFAAPRDDSSEFLIPSREFLQLHIYDVDSGNEQRLHLGFTASKRVPSWAPDGERIAYMAMEDYTLGSLDLENWNIYVVNVNDIEEPELVVSGGVHPSWSPDGSKLLFLKKDGLYLYDFNTNKSSKVQDVFPNEEPIFIKLIVSHDSTMLAWTNVWEVVVLRIVSWDPFETQLLTRFNPPWGNAVWPVFSPDNQYLVTQEISLNEDGLDTSYIRVYNLETLESMKLGGLDAYNRDVIFMTDWR